MLTANHRNATPSRSSHRYRLRRETDSHSNTPIARPTYHPIAVAPSCAPATVVGAAHVLAGQRADTPARGDGREPMIVGRGFLG